MHDLKKKSTVLPLLDFLENAINIEYTFRQVATESDFNYYIDHLQQPSYNAYDLIYLCFHGQKKCICFADKTDLALMAFAEKDENLGIFEGRNVHFGSCSTLKMREEDIKMFKQLTKARMITGYTKDVDLTSSFIFETWLMDAINRNRRICHKTRNDLAEKRCHTLQSYLDSRHIRFKDKYIKSVFVKHFLLTSLLTFIVGVCSAQTEHMKFKGVPMEGTLQTFTSKLKAKGFML